MIPKFNSIFGLLPPGIHEARWPDLVAVLGFTQRRKNQLEGLRHASLQLRSAGAAHLYVDGSFATQKKQPRDWDGCYSCRGVDPAKLDPVLKDYSNGRAAMKAKYGGEVFIAEALALVPFGPTYLDFFQKDRATGRPKGIIRLDLGTIQ